MSMEIKNISSNLPSQLGEAKSSEQAKKSSEDVTIARNDSVHTDKVSLQEQSKLKNESLFAKIELSKLEQQSFDKLKSFKSKLTEYELALQNSPESANNTEIGRLINDPDVLEAIASKILG